MRRYTALLALGASLSLQGPVAAQETRYDDLICSYGWSCPQALAVMRCESRGDARALSPAGYRGLFQISPAHGWRVGGDLDALYQPEVNVRVAWELYGESNWAPWVGCR